jgi:hypothetical protein
MWALRRARAEASRALHAAPGRLHAVLRRPASRSPGRAPWGPAQRRGLAASLWATPAPPLVVQEDGRAVTDHPARLARLAPALPAATHTWRLLPGGNAWQARRDVQCTGAVPSVAARGALARDPRAFRWAMAQAVPRSASTPQRAPAFRKRDSPRPRASCRGAAPVWCQPRACDAAATTPRPETAKALSWAGVLLLRSRSHNRDNASL